MFVKGDPGTGTGPYLYHPVYFFAILMHFHSKPPAELTRPCIIDTFSTLRNGMQVPYSLKTATNN
jgi:hypothetical protein